MRVTLLSNSLLKSFKENQTVYFPWLERIVLCLAVIICYASVWPNEFIFDDKSLIVHNAILKHWSNIFRIFASLDFTGREWKGQGFYRPIPTLLHLFIYQAFGASTMAFHTLAISLHALNACLLHRFGIRAGFKKGVAFAAALLWAVHPLHTEAVAYMAATSELLWSAFCLLGLIVLLPDFTPRKIGLAMIFFVLALGSKESAVVFPALATATLFLADKHRARLPIYLTTWPLWLLAAGYGAAWVFFMHKTGYTMDKTGDPAFFLSYTSNLINRILTCFATLPVYARLIIWPAGLHMERIFPVSSTLLAWQPALGALMVILGFVQILWGRAQRGLALSFGLLWFAVALSPATGIVVSVDALIHESWLYMPTMGLFLGVAQTVAGVFEKTKNAARLVVPVLAFSLGVATFFQNEVWRNPETFYQNIADNGGSVARISSHLGIYYMSKYDFDKALEQFQYVINHPDGRSDLEWSDSHMNMAMAWLRVRASDKDGITEVTIDDVVRALPSCRHIPEAIAELGKASMLDPDSAWIHQALSVLYRYQGNVQMADFHEKRVKELLQKKQDATE